MIVMTHIDFSWTLRELFMVLLSQFTAARAIKQSVALRLSYFHHLAF